MTLTKSQVNKAGKTLRLWWQDDNAPIADEQIEAFALLTRYRAAHSLPLLTANNGLRSMLRSEDCPVDVSQRLKRLITILRKLDRYPTMALSTMQDIGGCRAIVEDLAQLRRVEKRVARRRPPLRIDDYVTNPRPSGYRAVHMVVQYGDRCIEIQLRTRLMHEWAVAVEQIGGRMDVDLKSGSGPPEVLEWLEAISQALRLEELGDPVDTTLTERINQLRVRAIPFVKGGTP